jgi:hypothetical protein
MTKGRLDKKQRQDDQRRKRAQAAPARATGAKEPLRALVHGWVSGHKLTVLAFHDGCSATTLVRRLDEALLTMSGGAG